MEDTAVYLMQCGGFYKVGISADPWKRLKTLQTGSPLEIRLIHSVWLPRHLAHLAEADIHFRFRGTRVRGEWFTADGGELRELLDDAEDEYHWSGSVITVAP